MQVYCSQLQSASFFMYYTATSVRFILTVRHQSLLRVKESGIAPVWDMLLSSALSMEKENDPTAISRPAHFTENEIRPTRLLYSYLGLKAKNIFCTPTAESQIFPIFWTNI